MYVIEKGRFNLKPAAMVTILLLMLALQACSTVSKPELSEQEPLNHPHGLFGIKPSIPDAEMLFVLDPEQQEHLAAFMAVGPQHDRHKRLYQYIKQLTRHFNYQEDTLSAKEALYQKRGNCLTLAILTTALAKYSGIEVGYQLVNDVPVYEFGGSLVIKGVHIRSILYDPEWQEPPKDTIVFTRPGISIDYFPSGKERFIGNLQEDDFIAMYYSNIAIEFLQQQKLDIAYWYAQEGLQYSLNNTDTINLLAVIGRQKGADDYAEQLYLFGIEHASNKLSLLKNYKILLLAQNRKQEASQVEQMLNNIDDPSPFHWFLLAQDMLNKGDLSEAIYYYKKALELAPYLHEAYFGLAQAEYKAGRPDRARVELISALENVGKVSTRQSYKAKLLSLNNEI